jgi:hypothetical protein
MRKRLPLIIGIIILIVLFAAGWHYYRIFAFKSALQPLALRDNLLFREMLAKAGSLPDPSPDNLFQKVRNNIQARNEIISKVRSLNPYIYKQEARLYLELLELENKYSLSLLELNRALLEADKAQIGGMVEEEVEVVKQVGKKSVVHREKVFKRDLAIFKDIMDRKRAALSAHLKISNELKAFEIKNTPKLKKIIPARNIVPLLEEAGRQLYQGIEEAEE